MILHAENGINPKAFKELYVYAFCLVNNAIASKKTVVLNAKSPNKTMKENFEVLTEHSETLSSQGWTVLDLASFQPHVERLLAQQKKRIDRDAYLYNFLLRLIADGVFTQIHFCKNCFQNPDVDVAFHDTTFAYITAKRHGIPIVELE